MNWHGLMKKLFGSSSGPVGGFLEDNLTKDELLLLKHCMERLKLDYKSLFQFSDDMKVHNQMELYASDKLAPTIKDIFSDPEIGVILKAEVLLNAAPAFVKEELRNFCHS